MFHKSFVPAVALAAAIGLSACGGDAEEPEVIEEPAPRRPSEPVQVAPEVTEGAVIMGVDSTWRQRPGSN